jgi:hypothetical protein
MTTSKKKLALIFIVALIILVALLAKLMVPPPRPSSATTSLQTYTLTITIVGSGSVTKNPNQANYTWGTIVTLTASPSTGWSFSSWSGDASVTSLSTTVNMTSNKAVTATFTQNKYTLTIDSTAGGTTSPAPGTYQELSGTNVTVTETPSSGYTFSYWSLDGTNVGTSTSYTVTMNANHTLHAVFKLPPPKYYLTIISPYGTPGGSGWYNANDTAYATLNTSIVDYGNGTRRVFTHWSGDASGTDYSKSDPILMDENKTAVANWKTQYNLTVTSPHDTPTPTSGWFDAGTLINESVTSPWPGATGTRYVCTGWTGTGSVPPSGSGTTVTFTINVSSTITWTWKTQYYLTVSSTQGTAGGSGWYNANDTAYATVTPLTVLGSTGTRYVFTQWSGDASGNTSPSNPIIMNGPKTAVANWKTQYYLTVNTDPTGLSLAPTPSSGWYNESTNIQLTAPDPNYKGFVGYFFKYWDVDGSNVSGNPITVYMDRPHTVTACYQEAPPLPVGGYARPIDKLHSPAQTMGLAQRIGLAFALALVVAMAATVLLARRKGKMLK